MHLSPIFFVLIFSYFSDLSESAAVSVSYTTGSSWSTGSTLTFVFTNSGSSNVCAVTFSMTLPSGTAVSSSWNMNAVSGSSTQYTLPSWINISSGGGTYSSTGVSLSGTGTPTLAVVSYTACSGTTTTTTTSGTTTTTTAGSGTTTTTTSSATTTTTTSSSSNTTLVVDPVYTTANTCLSEDTTGPIDSYLNQAITGGKFTYYGIGGRGACGLDTDTPTYSAAASGTLFNSSAQWVASCMSDGRYMLNDSVCIDKCVKISYGGKTLTVPINNQCPECAVNHVDLSEDAFLWLEPAGGTVGVATNATITYLKCS